MRWAALLATCWLAACEEGPPPEALWAAAGQGAEGAVKGEARVGTATFGELDDGPCLTEAAVRERVFMPDCATSGCHTAQDARADLDLETPGVAERLTGAGSLHERCADRALIVPGDAAASFLMQKVLPLPTGCGDPMPTLGALRPDQVRCLGEWIETIPAG